MSETFRYRRNIYQNLFFAKCLVRASCLPTPLNRKWYCLRVEFGAAMQSKPINTRKAGRLVTGRASAAQLLPV